MSIDDKNSVVSLVAKALGEGAGMLQDIEKMRGELEATRVKTR
jgi:hypothetical protein